MLLRFYLLILSLILFNIIDQYILNERLLSFQYQILLIIYKEIKHLFTMMFLILQIFNIQMVEHLHFEPT